MLENLLTRIEQLSAVGRFSNFLMAAKKASNIDRSAFRATGSIKQVFDGAREAVNGGFISIEELISFVDSIDENGAQHIFLFKVSDSFHAEFRKRVSSH